MKSNGLLTFNEIIFFDFTHHFVLGTCCWQHFGYLLVLLEDIVVFQINIRLPILNIIYLKVHFS